MTPSPADLFRQTFAAEPAVVTAAPGRVNLIGEHTDYSALPVLPFAIDRRTAVAAAPLDAPRIEAVSETFPVPASFAPGTPPAELLEPWHRYLAAAVALLQPPRGVGARIAITSQLPPASGLSSSSALMVALVAALNAAWGLALTPEAIADLAARAERLAGAETGGMDQQVIAFARAGHLLRIDFLPPARRHIPVPPGWAFVVASSGQPAPKGGAARDAYNQRVVGTRVAAALLADMLGVELEGTPLLGHVAGIDAAPVLVEELPERAAPRGIARSLGIPLEWLTALSSGAALDPDAPVPVRPFARHVLSEAERVEAACRAVESADLAALGRLLDASHASLRDDYRCSSPALDAIVAALRKAGAAGARLTGAGFGGFAVGLCERGREPALVEAAIAAAGGPAFAVTPSDGALFQ